jgi:large subunit ribosomal protein L4
MVQLALRSALSDRAAEGKVAVVDAWDFEAPKTRDAKDSLESLSLNGKVLLVLSRDDETAYKAFRNLTDVQPILDAELNAYDILCNDWLVFTKATLPGGGEAAAPAAPAAPTTEPEAPAAASEPAPAEDQA